MPSPYLSIVIPILHEAESLPQLYGELTQVLEDRGYSYEIIFIDDGSRDDSFKILKELQFEDRRLRVIRFRRRFGQTAAFAAGFRAAHGEWIVTMDGDLQNDPHDIPNMLAIAEAGYDVVSGWREHRKDRFFSRRLPSMVANWLISLVTGVHLHDFGCSLKVYHRLVAKEVQLYGEMHRFIPALTSRIGAQIAEVKVNHRARRFGSSKYTLSRTVRTLLDLVTVRFLMAYDTRPIHVFGALGLVSTGLGVLLGLYLSYLKLVQGQAIGDRPLLMLAVLLVLVGVQFVSTGLLAEVLMRTYYEAQGKPTYFVREVLDAELAPPEREDALQASDLRGRARNPLVSVAPPN